MTALSLLFRDPSLGADDFADGVEDASASAFVMAWCAVDPTERAYRGVVLRGEWLLTVYRLGESVAHGHGRDDSAAMRDLGRELWRATRGDLR